MDGRRLIHAITGPASVSQGTLAGRFDPRATSASIDRKIKETNYRREMDARRPATSYRWTYGRVHALEWDSFQFRDGDGRESTQDARKETCAIHVLIVGFRPITTNTRLVSHLLPGRIATTGLYLVVKGEMSSTGDPTLTMSKPSMMHTMMQCETWRGVPAIQSSSQLRMIQHLRSLTSPLVPVTPYSLVITGM